MIALAIMALKVTIYEINRCSERSEDVLREAEPSLAFFMQGLHDRVSDYDTKGRVDLEEILINSFFV